MRLSALAVIVGGIAAAGCRPPRLAQAVPVPRMQESFWSALESQCGRAFRGTLTEGSAGDSAFRAAEVIMHVRSCSPNEIRIPLHVGEDRSRTWVITRVDGGLRLKHDHRHADGTEDRITQYGGDTRGEGSATRQEFYADAHTASLIPAARTNVWTIEIVRAENRFVYALRREGTDRRFRVEFDLGQPVPWPPAPWGAKNADRRDSYPHAAESIGTVRQSYDGVLSPEMAVNTFRNIDRLFPARTVPRSAAPHPLPLGTPLGEVSFSDRGKRYSLEDYLELNRVAGLLVLHDGRIKLERYRFGNTGRTRWMSMSIAKSITSTLIGAALKQGRIASLDDPVTKYVPSLAGSAYDGASVRDILTMSSGVRWTETYTDPTSDRRRLLEAQISQKPGSALAVMKSLPRAAEPGTVNNYNTGETLIAAEIVRGAVGQSLSAYLAERIWQRFGMEADANWWLDSPDGLEIGGSGFSATLRDYGRFGLFILNGGHAGGEAILPADWVREATTPRVLRGGTPLDYGYLWWPGLTPASRRDGAFDAAGIHGQYLYVNPAARVVIVVWSAQPKPTGGEVIDEWAFFDAVTEAVRRDD